MISWCHCPTTVQDFILGVIGTLTLTVIDNLGGGKLPLGLDRCWEHSRWQNSRVPEKGDVCVYVCVCDCLPLLCVSVCVWNAHTHMEKRKWLVLTKSFSLLEEKGFRKPTLSPAVHCCWVRHKTLPLTIKSFAFFQLLPFISHCALPTVHPSYPLAWFHNTQSPLDLDPFHRCAPTPLSLTDYFTCVEKTADLQRPAFQGCIPPVDKRRDVLGVEACTWNTSTLNLKPRLGCMETLCLKTKTKSILEKRDILNLSPFLCRNWLTDT